MTLWIYVAADQPKRENSTTLFLSTLVCCKVSEYVVVSYLSLRPTIGLKLMFSFVGRHFLWVVAICPHMKDVYPVIASLYVIVNSLPGPDSGCSCLLTSLTLYSSVFASFLNASFHEWVYWSLLFCLPRDIFLYHVNVHDKASFHVDGHLHLIHHFFSL